MASFISCISEQEAMAPSTLRGASRKPLSEPRIGTGTDLAPSHPPHRGFRQHPLTSSTICWPLGTISTKVWMTRSLSLGDVLGRWGRLGWEKKEIKPGTGHPPPQSHQPPGGCPAYSGFWAAPRWWWRTSVPMAMAKLVLPTPVWQPKSSAGGGLPGSRSSRLGLS